MCCNLVGAFALTITDAKPYVPIVTLSTEDNAKLSKVLSKGFKRPGYWTKQEKVMIAQLFGYWILLISKKQLQSNCS